ncbi:MAG TPA: NAD(P)-dependent oxidoreductase [Candidatus Nanoarchaeia archaeon]|nr:NAD(P)-dependent oxidoreductase [Candidatus Nanoarchaeia archaeon]
MENDKKKVLIATGTPFDLDVRVRMANTLMANGLDVAVLENYQGWQLEEEISSANYLIVRSDKIDRQLIDRASNLELIVRAGSGINTIDVDYAQLKGIEVQNTNGANAVSVAELAVGMMVTLARDLHMQNYQAGNPAKQNGHFEMFGKKIGLHGFGAVGVQVARRAKAFGLNIFAYDTNPEIDYNPPGMEKSFGFDSVTGARNIEDVYRNSQFVSIHVPLTDETEGKVNYELISLMRSNGILINTARPEIVNYGDLARIMEENPKFKYAADVSKDEFREFAENNGLAEFKSRLFITNKIGAQTYEANHNAAIQAANKVIEYKQRMDRVIVADSTFLQ